MKIICTVENLMRGVNIVSKAVPTRTTMPILECILFDATANHIKLTANDTELGIETIIKGKIEEPGTVALDAKFISDVVRKFEDKNSEFIVQSDSDCHALITCEKSVFHILGKSNEDFPYLPDIDRDEPITLSQFMLKEVIRQTIFSISDNDNNKLMTGELFEIKENKLKVVSLDGHRISIRKVELENNYESKKVIVPGKTLQEISKIIPGSNEEFVEIYLSRNHILFEFEDTIVVSRLIDGDYFNIDQMLSSAYETKINVNKRLLLNCIDRSLLMVKEGDKKPIIMDIQDEVMEIKITSFNGSMNESIDIQKEGIDMLIGFNPKFFIDALRVIDDDIVTLYMVNPKAPCFIRDEDEQYVYLILPVNFTTT